MIQFERIKELAKKRKMSLVEVNDKAGLGTRSIYHWKTSTPPSDKLKTVANVLGTTTDYLNGATDNPEPHHKKIDNNKRSKLNWKDLGMPYGGEIPDDLQSMVDSLAESYFKSHPESIKKEYRDDF